MEIEFPELPEKLSDVIGLIPAAGLGSRLGSLPCSKEIYPLKLAKSKADGLPGSKVVCEFLLERLKRAGIYRAFVIIRPGKWDIQAYLGDGGKYNFHLAYLMMGHPFGSPFSLDQAWSFVQKNRVALGFPDIIFRPEDAYSRLLEHQEDLKADIVLGLFPTDRPQKWDMVETNSQGQVTQIIIKPQHSALRHCWVNAIWTPKFSAFLHDYLAGVVRHARETDSLKQLADQEFYVGNVIQAWMAVGFPVESVTFSEGNCLDIGTPEDLSRGMDPA
jgi:glucose-1-phosphate thymidylyltransferase